MDKRTICLLNDSFPPEIDGVANAVVNYAKNITKSGENAIVVTPTMPGGGRQRVPIPRAALPEHRHAQEACGLRGGLSRFHPRPRACPDGARRSTLMHSALSRSRRALLARSLRAVVDAPLVLTYHTKYDVDIAKAVRGKLLQEERHSRCSRAEHRKPAMRSGSVSRGAGENLRSHRLRGRLHRDGKRRGRAAQGGCLTKRSSPQATEGNMTCRRTCRSFSSSGG